MYSVSLNNNESSEAPFRGLGGKTAIILAGGLGTRLRDAVPDLPKCMAPVAGVPFITYVIRYLLSQGIEKFIFSVGYKYDIIQEFLDTHYPTLNIQYSIEAAPLGTGGAVKSACSKASEKTVLIVNGDTLFKARLDKLFSFHHKTGSTCTLSLKPINNFDRHGVVELNQDYSIKSFKENQFYESGLINGGVYALDVEKFLAEKLPEKFSFEKDFLQKVQEQPQFNQNSLYGIVQDEYFIDIGIPEDYKRAQEELKLNALDLTKIDSHWTLFLDRDGVINYEKKGDYIRNWSEYQFYDGVKEAIKIFSEKFGRIIIVSNQRGVEKGLMTENDLTDIHQKMKAEIDQAGGRIDKIYYCTSINNKNMCRKPNPGMAFKAAADFPEIDLSKSVIVGNKPGDMLFGRNAGMRTVYLKTTHPDQPLPHPDIDLSFENLPEFAKAL